MPGLFSTFLTTDQSQYGKVTSRLRPISSFSYVGQEDTKTELFEQEPTEDTEDNLTSVLVSACKSYLCGLPVLLFKSLFVLSLCAFASLREIFSVALNRLSNGEQDFFD